MFNPNIPRQSIIAVYKKGEDVITYNGVHWVYNGKVVQFLEDMKNTNTPDKQG